MHYLEARKELHRVGIRLIHDREWGEYVVNFTGGGEITAYHTPDLDDAVDTGFAMAADAQARCPATQRAALCFEHAA